MSTCPLRYGLCMRACVLRVWVEGLFSRLMLLLRVAAGSIAGVAYATEFVLDYHLFVLSCLIFLFFLRDSFVFLQMEKFTGADLTEICQRAAKIAIRENIMKVRLDSLCSTRFLFATWCFELKSFGFPFCKDTERERLLPVFSTRSLFNWCCNAKRSVFFFSTIRTWSANAFVARPATPWRTWRRRTPCPRSSRATSRTPSATRAAPCRTGTSRSTRASRKTSSRCVFVVSCVRVLSPALEARTFDICGYVRHRTSTPSGNASLLLYVYAARLCLRLFSVVVAFAPPPLPKRLPCLRRVKLFPHHRYRAHSVDAR